MHKNQVTYCPLTERDTKRERGGERKREREGEREETLVILGQMFS